MWLALVIINIKQKIYFPLYLICNTHEWTLIFHHHSERPFEWSLMKLLFALFWYKMENNICSYLFVSVAEWAENCTETSQMYHNRVRWRCEYCIHHRYPWIVCQWKQSCISKVENASCEINRLFWNLITHHIQNVQSIFNCAHSTSIFNKADQELAKFNISIWSSYFSVSFKFFQAFFHSVKDTRTGLNHTCLCLGFPVAYWLINITDDVIKAIGGTLWQLRLISPCILTSYVIQYQLNRQSDFLITSRSNDKLKTMYTLKRWKMT